MAELPVLIVHGTDAWYGSDRALFTLAHALRERGLAPTIALTLPAGEGAGPLSRRLDDAGFSVCRIPGSLFDRDALHSPIRSTIAAVRGAYAVARLSRQLGGPVLANTSLVAHLVLPARLLGQPCGVVFREIQLSPPGARFVSRHVYARLATFTVAISEAVQRFNVPKAARQRSLVVLDEIVGTTPDAASAPSRIRDLDDEVPIVLVVGRLNPARAPHLALEAAERCISAGCDLRLVFLGEADSDAHAEYIENLRARAERSTLRGRVEFVGFEENPGPWFESAAVVLNPRPVEPLGHVLFEAFGAGRPVVAAAAGGPLEIIDHGVTGMLYRPGDAEAMAQKLTWLLERPVDRARIGAAAKARQYEFVAESIASHDTLAAKLRELDGRSSR